MTRIAALERELENAYRHGQEMAAEVLRLTPLVEQADATAIVNLRSVVAEWKRALARADGVIRECVSLMTDAMNSRRHSTKTTFSYAEVEVWRNALAAYLRAREGDSYE